MNNEVALWLVPLAACAPSMASAEDHFAHSIAAATRSEADCQNRDQQGRWRTAATDVSAHRSIGEWSSTQFANAGDATCVGVALDAAFSADLFLVYIEAYAPNISVAGPILNEQRSQRLEAQSKRGHGDVVAIIESMVPREKARAAELLSLTSSETKRSISRASKKSQDGELGSDAPDASPETQTAADRAQEGLRDPWEGSNRTLFAVHEAIDSAVIEPVARAYHAFTPRLLREGIGNFLSNLRGPVIFANDLLQGEVDRAGVTAARFVVNTTVGVGGVLDPAATMNLERHDEDFGQTLAVWGVDAGPYVFIPVLGPTTVRDGLGRMIDVIFDPVTFARGENAGSWRTARSVTTGIAAREQVLEAVDAIRSDFVDPYVTIRSTYGLIREGAVHNGSTDVGELPDFGAPQQEIEAPTPVS